MSKAGLLFQAAMWRRYAMEWDTRIGSPRHEWAEKVLQVSRSECLQRARQALIAATAHPESEGA